MFSTSLLLALPLLAVIPHKALAHGSVSKVVIDGKSFAGNAPGQSGKDSVIRQVADVEPVKGANNKELSCGHKAEPAALVADALPGSKVEVHWVGGDQGNWVHNTGPMMTFLAKCDGGDCTKFDSADAKWFKINEVGRTKSGGDWAQAALMKGEPASFTLPNNLAAGSYLMRHELIALQLATSKGGAEFYPSCSQIKVGGNESGAPKDSELVSLPGSYSDNDPGIFVPDVFDNASADYKFPGPDVASFISGSSSASGKTSSSSGKCSLKKNSNKQKRSLAVQRPKRISRVMKGLAVTGHASH